ncbi:SRPBCC family protein [Aliikangiella sp. IMCC44632]
MKYINEIEVNVARDTMIELFDDPDNLTKWMPNLESFQPISGEPGQVGAKSKFVVSHGKKQCELIETITLRELPERFEGTYETDGMWNQVKNQFVVVDENTTKWIAESEFKSDKLVMKFLMFFMPFAFKKESLKFMQSFKTFAEQQS